MVHYLTVVWEVLYMHVLCFCFVCHSQEEMYLKCLFFVCFGPILFKYK